MAVGEQGGLLGHGGALSDSAFSWRGTTHSIVGIFLSRDPYDPARSNTVIGFAPALPGESSRLQLRIGGTALDLADGDIGGGFFFWSAADADWAAGGTVAVALRDFPPQIEHRSMDGRGNNFGHHSLGAAGTAQIRIAPNSYTDGVSAPADSRPNARAASNQLFSQQESVPSTAGASDMFWQWGQFVDHDIVLSPDNPSEPFPIPVPAGDPHFDPEGTGQAAIGLRRTAFAPGTGTGRHNPARQTNNTTAFVDASQVYGPDDARAIALRANDGTGRLSTSQNGRLLPLNDHGLENDGGRHLEDLFVAGDVRANEQIGLTALHTVFFREHNRLAAIIAGQDPRLSGDEIYQLARRIVGAQNQAITYNEFMPLLLGPDAIGPYTGYDPGVDPTVANEFSAAAFRVGHTMLSPGLLLVGADGQQARISLAEAFFNPQLVADNGISPILRGLAAQPAQQVDTLVVDEVRNMLLRGPNGPAFDLAALNIQRGRDHGVGDYNTVRRSYGLEPVGAFSEISSDPDLQRALRAAYPDIENLDLWTGALAEDHAPGAMVGETLQAIIADQFRRIRDGDRFWYENDPYFLANPDLLDEIRRTTLADIIRRNTPIEDEIQDNAFIAEPGN